MSYHILIYFYFIVLNYFFPGNPNISYRINVVNVINIIFIINIKKIFVKIINIINVSN